MTIQNCFVSPDGSGCSNFAKWMTARNVEFLQNTTLLTQSRNFPVTYEGYCVIECERWVYIISW